MTRRIRFTIRRIWWFAAWVGKMLATAWVGPGSVVLGGSGLPPDPPQEAPSAPVEVSRGGLRSGGFTRQRLRQYIAGPILAALLVVLVVPLPWPWGPLVAVVVFLVATLLSVVRRPSD